MTDMVVKVANEPDIWGDVYPLDVLRRIVEDDKNFGIGYYMDGDRLMKRMNVEFSCDETNMACSCRVSKNEGELCG